MHIYSSCREAVADCIARKYFSVSHQYSSEKTMDMHVHDCYEVYFSISGGRQFLIDDRFYDIAPGDVFFINQYESHHLTQIDRETHERIVLSIHPRFVRSLCTETTDLDACFREHPPQQSHRVSLMPEEQRHFMRFIDELAAIEGYGADVRERAAIAGLLVFLCGCYQASVRGESGRPRDPQVDRILAYINGHLEEDLSLECLAGRFYLSTSYLCRIFRAATGTTINKYITAQRVTRAKQLLEAGCGAAEAGARCGFHDYNNFYKAFKSATQVSPGKYARMKAPQG